jgi:hypothetical protein
MPPMPTVILFLFALGVGLLAYELIYPVVVAGSFNRLIIADLCLTIATLTVVGAKFMGTDHLFSFGLFELSWLPATLLCLFAVEGVLVPRYCRRFGINLFKPPTE